MRKSGVVAALLAGFLALPSSAEEPLRPGYRIDEHLELLFREYLVAGPNVDEPRESHYLVCAYSTRPVVMVYARKITPPLLRLLKKLDDAVQTGRTERLGGYLVLLGDRPARTRELKALAENTGLRHIHLATAEPSRRFAARFAAEAETTVILATPQRRGKACHAFRKGELRDKDSDRILADLARILPKKD